MLRCTQTHFPNFKPTVFHRFATAVRTLSTGESNVSQALPSESDPASSPLPSSTLTPPIDPWPFRLHPKRLVSMIARQTDPHLALQIFHFAGKCHPGFSHDGATYLSIVQRLSRARAFVPMESLLSDLHNSKIQCGESLFVAVIRNYGVASRPESALKTFLRMDAFGVRRSARTLNTLLNALVQNKRYDLFHSVFKNCKEKFNVSPDLVTCNILIKALCKRNDVEEAIRVLDEMPAMGVVPNVVTYTTILGGFVGREDMEGAKKGFGEILDRGCHPDATTYTILVNGFCRLGMFVDAIKVMDDMEENGVNPNEVTYRIMIESYCKAMMGGEALNLFNDMLDRNYVPCLSLFCKVVDVLCVVGKVEDAHGLLKKLLQKNIVPDNAITSTLIHWLLKKGKIREARELFEEFSRVCIPNILTYNTIIGGMCEKGELSEVNKLWKEMMKKGCGCNAFTYNMLIKGWCKAGNAKEGIEVLKVMLSKGCFPNRLTYTILMESLSESGMEGELSNVISTAMSTEGADSDAWGIFLSKIGLDTGLNVV